MRFSAIHASRRTFMAGSGLGLAAMLAPVSVFAHPTGLDLTDPANRLRAMVRLRGAEDMPFWILIEGTVYGRDPDSTLKPLFGFTSLLRLQYERESETSFVFQQRESAHYTHIDSGEPVGEFHNPYQDRSNHAIGYVSPLLRYRFDLNGTRPIAKSDHMGDLPHQLSESGGYLQTTERRFLSYPSSLDLEKFPLASNSTTRRSVDIATYRAPVGDVTDLSKDFVPAAIDFVADTEWPYWMFMGDHPGNAWWLGHGAKLRDISELAPETAQRIEHVHPGFLADPFGMDGSSYRTDVQMLRLREAGVI